MEPVAQGHASIEPKLGLWDAVSIIVGIIFAWIFSTPASFETRSGCMDRQWRVGLGGAAALIGALCFAELGCRVPAIRGGMLHHARFWLARRFPFAWAQLVIIRPGSIGAVAISSQSTPTGCWASAQWQLVLACVSVVLDIYQRRGVELGA